MNHFWAAMKRIYMIIAYQLLTISLIFFSLEMGTRLLTKHISPIDINAETIVTDSNQAPFFRYHPFAAFSWIPNARFLRQTVNGEGFVSTRDIPFKKEQNEIRIVTLGGSSTVGNGNYDEHTYPRILEKLLQTSFPDKKISVLNAAAGGYSTRESLGYFQSRIRYFSPDIVLVMHGWNDMYYFTKTDEKISKWRENFNLEVMWNRNAEAKKEDPMPAHIQYLSWSQLYLHLYDWVRFSSFFQRKTPMTLEKRYESIEKREDGTYKLVLKDINPTAYNVYSSNLAQLQSLCAANNIQIFSILQPTLVSEKANRNSPTIQRAVETSALYHGFTFEKHIAVFQKIYQISRDIFGYKIIDTLEMNGNETLFFDHIHQNSKGTQKLAELVFAKVKEAISHPQSSSHSN